MWLKINDPAGTNSTFINLDEMLDIQLAGTELRLAMPGRNYRISPEDAPQAYKKICSSLESGFQGAVECEAGLVIA